MIAPLSSNSVKAESTCGTERLLLRTNESNCAGCVCSLLSTICAVLETLSARKLKFFCSAFLYQPLLQWNHSTIWFSVSLKLFFSSCFFPLLSLPICEATIWWLSSSFFGLQFLSLPVSKRKTRKTRVANTIIEGICVFEMNELNTSRNHYDASTAEDHTACFQHPHTRGSTSTSWAKKEENTSTLVS